MRLFQCVIIAGLLVAGCSDRARDFSQLPQDFQERAKLCFGAAHSYLVLARDSGLAQAEIDRRQAVEDELRRATDIDSFMTDAGEDAYLEERLRQFERGNLVSDLNRCKAAYGIGAPESLASLPRDPGDRLFACAVSSAIKSRAGADRGINPYFDPQGFHFLMQLRQREGVDAFSRRAATTESVAHEMMAQGTVDAFVDQCIEENPAAALDRQVELPADPGLRAGICRAVTVALAEQSPDNPLRLEYLPRAQRIAGPLEAALAGGAAPSDRVGQAIAGLGTSTGIFAACERAYPRPG